MGIVEILLIAVGLSMDAFAVSICKGLAMSKFSVKNAFVVGAWFGIFQGLMPIIGFFLGYSFAEKIGKFSPFVAFVLLAFIGVNMVHEAFSKKDEEPDASLGFRIMLIMALATSIDALAVGVTFAISGVSTTGIFPAALIIAATTFLISSAGVYIGNIFGSKYKSASELVGGLILIGIGIKFLCEGIINLT